MGDMAAVALAEALEMEHLRDEYVQGQVTAQEAYDLGITDSYGTEQEGVEAAWDRSSIGTCEELDREIDHLLRIIGG